MNATRYLSHRTEVESHIDHMYVCLSICLQSATVKEITRQSLRVERISLRLIAMQQT